MANITSEIVIVGGGIAGSATALYLADLGHEVVLLERGEVAAEASGLNMGGLGGSGWGEPPDLQGYLTLGSVALFETLQTDLGYDLEFRLSGNVQAIQTAAEFEFARDRVLAARAKGHDLELLTTHQARALEPALNPALHGVVFGGPNRGQANPVKTTRAFAQAAQEAGARLLTGCEVTGMEADGATGFRIATPTHRVRAGTLVLAAGAWCRPLGSMLGLDVPITPIRGQMWATEPLPPRVFHTVSATQSPHAWHLNRYAAAGEPPDQTHLGTQRLTRHLYGRQTAAGEVIFGGDRQALGDVQTVDQDGIASNKAHATEVLPFLATLPIKRTWAGLMPFSPDGEPLIGALPGYDNLYIVGGLGSSGFGRGPKAGKLLADTIHNGRPAECLEDADPARCVRT